MIPTGPNVVLVVLDTARADAVGDGRDTAFAQLGRRGRRFHRAVAPAPWTLPSHASILSGMRPSEHGITGSAVMTPAGPRSPRPLVHAMDERWLPEHLRRSGYATFCASGNPWMGEATGLTFGFEKVFESWRTARLPKLADPLAPGGRSSGSARKAAVYARRALGAGDGGAAASLRVFRTFLDGRAGRPFLGFFNVMEPHAPYAPPRGHTGGLGLGSRVAALKAVRRWNAERMLAYCMGREEISDEELALLRTLYRGEVRYADGWLARLLEMLDRQRLLDETIVIVTADHGENLGEHHRLSHVMSMHETLLHVPLAIAGPTVEAGEEREPVGLTALRETVLAAVTGRWADPVKAEMPVAEYESAASQVSGARRLDEQVGEAPEELRDRLRARWVAAYEGSFKYTATSAGEERLVDLEADPGEAVDVGPANPEVLARLRAARGTWSGEPAGDGERLDAEITAHLEGLGYL
jgi:arylsulfatase A-like enzyme